MRFYAHSRLGLAEYFKELSDAWRGWDGAKVWEALEGDVRLAASHDGLGHVALLAELRAQPTVRRKPDWCASLVLGLDGAWIGSLERRVISTDRRYRFGREPTLGLGQSLATALREHGQW